MSKRGKARDFTMARLGAALAQLEEAKDMCFNALQVFTDPNDDPSGEDRVETIQSSMMAANGAVLSLQEALEGTAHMSMSELEMCEPHLQDDVDGNEEIDEETEGAEEDGSEGD